MKLRERAGRRFARLATVAVVRFPRLWRVFRGLVARQFGSLAPRWDSMRNPNHLAPFERALEAVAPPPRRALDLGTGTGAAAVAIARRFPEATVVGLDLAPEMVEQARRNLPADLAARVAYEHGDAARLAFPDGAFDLVALANMIPFFDELSRVVAPGGAVVFGFSMGTGTPIYVPPERLRAQLAARGFTEFADFRAADGTAFLARKASSS